MKKLFIFPLLLLSQISFASSIDGKDFVDCFEKAINERIEDIKAENPKIKNICSSFSDEARRKLDDLYTYKGADRNLHFYDRQAMGYESISFHFERIQFNVNCYKELKFLPILLFKRLGQAVKDAAGGKPHNDMQLVEDAISKMIGRPMWTENGIDQFGEHDFSYCSE